MQGIHFTVPFHFGGTLAADQVVRFAMPCDALLESISGCQSNAGSATLKAGLGGTPNDDDGFITAYAIGASGTPNVKKSGDFNGALVVAANGPLPRLKKGDVFWATLDFDGAAATAGQNVTLVFTFIEG
jgi:hypothetical protein